MADSTPLMGGALAGEVDPPGTVSCEEGESVSRKSVTKLGKLSIRGYPCGALATGPLGNLVLISAMPVSSVWLHSSCC